MIFIIANKNNLFIFLLYIFNWFEIHVAEFNTNIKILSTDIYSFI